MIQPPKQENPAAIRLQLSSTGITLDDEFYNRINKICIENDIDAEVYFSVKRGLIYFSYAVDIIVDGMKNTFSDTDINVLSRKVEKEMKQIKKKWYAVSKHGTEYSFARKPDRLIFRSCGDWVSDKESRIEQLPKGTIEKITGIKMTWLNEPIAVIRSEVKN